MKNRKAQIGITFTIGALIVIGIIILLILIAGGLLINTILKNIFYILGALIFILGMIFGVAKAPDDKKLKMFIIISIISLSVVLLQFAGLIRQSTYLGGYTSLSVSNVVVDGTGKIRIYGVAQGAENININFNANTLNNYINSQGYKATKDITGSIRFIKQSKSFSINKNLAENFYKLTYVNKGTFFKCSLDNCDASKPANNMQAYFAGRTLPLVGNCFCAYKYPIGINSIFNGASQKQFDVEFNIGGQTGHLTQDAKIVNLGNGATVEWSGDLSNLNNLEVPQYSLLFNEGTYQKLISASAYANRGNAISEYTSCVGAPKLDYFMSIYSLLTGITEDKLKSCQNTYNNKIDTILTSKSGDYLSSIQSYIKDSALIFSGDNLVLNLQSPTTFPTFIITLDATSAGVIQLKGEPKIIECTPSKTINSGDSYQTRLSVKNIGSNEGSFYGSITCNNGASGYLNELLVDAGSTAVLSGSITGDRNTEGTTSNSCKVTVIDRKSQLSDSCSFNVGIKYQSGLLCNPGKSQCIDDKTLRICNAEGSHYEDKKCDISCIVLSSGVGECSITLNETSNPDKISCEEKALKYPALGYEWIETETSSGFWIFKKTSQSGVCEATFIKYYIIIGIVLLVTVLTIILVIPNKSSKARGAKRKR